MQNRNKQTLRIFWQHTIRYRWQFWLTLIGVTIGNSVTLYIPLNYKRLFDLLATNDPSNAPLLFHILLIILLFHTIGWFFWRLASFGANYISAKVISDLQNSCFRYLHKHSYDFFTDTFSGSLVRKVNRYSRAFEDILDRLEWDLYPAALTLAIIIGVLAFRLWPLAVFVAVWSLVFILFNFFFARYKLKFDMARAETDSETTGHLSDTVTNNLNIKLFGSFKTEVKTFEKLTAKLTRRQLRSWYLDSWSEAFQGALMMGLEIGMMAIAIVYWRDGRLTVGDFALIQAYIIQIFGHLWNIGRHIRRIYEHLADAKEMTDILLTPHAVADPPSPQKLPPVTGAVSFEHVTFSYGAKKRPVLKDFSLDIQPGEHIALIGPSGGGKTTIVKLLFRFFDIQSGQIKLDGLDIASVTQDALRHELALVPQEPLLFHRSLFENIRYAEPTANKAAVLRAAKLAHCHEFITRFPDGYDTLVGERGVKLSGGERQRVAIARAFLKNAPILVLDEATSSLDSESERYIQAALKTLMRGKTTITIAHRLSTIMQMDKIYVIEAGRIMESGSHQALLATPAGRYQKLWQIQAGGFDAQPAASEAV